MKMLFKGKTDKKQKVYFWIRGNYGSFSSDGRGWKMEDEGGR